jgi:hypothetical protein
MKFQSNVGDRRTYEDGDQKHYSTAANRAVGTLNEVNTAAYMNKDEIVNELLYKEVRALLQKSHKLRLTFHVHVRSYRTSIESMSA